MSWQSWLLGTLLAFVLIGGGTHWYLYQDKAWTETLQGTLAQSGVPLGGAKLRLTDPTSKEKNVEVETTSTEAFLVVRHFNRTNYSLIFGGGRYGQLYLDANKGERLLWQDVGENRSAANISDAITCDVAVPVAQSRGDRQWVRVTATIPDDSVSVPVFCHPVSATPKTGP